MDRIEIIKCLCYQGNVESNGVIATDDSPRAMCENMFGTGNSHTVVDGEIKPYTSYLYAYKDRLTHPKYGERGADVVVTTYEGDAFDKVYLYEIE